MSMFEALDDPRGNTPYPLPPPGSTDKDSVGTGVEKKAVREIKEWQVIMDHLQTRPVTGPDILPTIPIDERAAEVRAINSA